MLPGGGSVYLYEHCPFWEVKSHWDKTSWCMWSVNQKVAETLATFWLEKFINSELSEASFVLTVCRMHCYKLVRKILLSLVFRNCSQVGLFSGGIHELFLEVGWQSWQQLSSRCKCVLCFCGGEVTHTHRVLSSPSLLLLILLWPIGASF